MAQFVARDLFFALLCCGIGAGLVYGAKYDAEHQKKEIIYFIQVLYGLLSAPFLIFLLPMMSDILTQSRPTGFDR